jgi:hypothetical protein
LDDPVAARTLTALASAALAVGLLSACVGTPAPSPTQPGPSVASPAPGSADSIQPELDAAVLAALPDDVVSVVTVQDADLPTCTTTLVTDAGSPGYSGADLEEAVRLLQVGALFVPCQSVVRVEQTDGTLVDVSHLEAYLPVVARDGELVLDTLQR